jgi:hypothetical protein
MLVLVGAMLKGQILLVAPVLVVWSVLSGFRPALELLAGLSASAAVCSCIWLVPSLEAFVCVSIAMLGGIVSWGLPRSGSSTSLSVFIAATVAVAWLSASRRWLALENAPAVALSLLVLAPRLAAVRRLRLSRGFYCASLLAAALWSACLAFGGSTAWARIAFIAPTDARNMMSLGATNLPNLLEAKWHLSTSDPIGNPSSCLAGFTLVTWRTALRVGYATSTVLCGVAAFVNARRGSYRTLAALTAPWVLAFTLLPQMHERYLVWAAIVSATAVRVSLNLALLHVAVTVLATADILRPLVSQDPTFAPVLLRLLRTVTPGSGWLLLAVAVAYVYESFKDDHALNGLPKQRGQVPARHG